MGKIASNTREWSGSLLSKRLIEGGQASTKGSRSIHRKRLQFVRGVKLSGYSMVSNFFSAMLFGIFGSRSTLSYLILLGITNTTTAFTTYFQVAAIRPPPSRFANLFFCRDESSDFQISRRLLRISSPTLETGATIKFQSDDGATPEPAMNESGQPVEAQPEEARQTAL
jgi:hypothetical protein